MTDRIQSDANPSRRARKAWRQPRVRAMVPASKTQGGFRILGGIEGGVYRVS